MGPRSNPLTNIQCPLCPDLSLPGLAMTLCVPGSMPPPMEMGATKVIQVTNIAPQATRDQMHTLFSFLGKVEDLRLYPSLR